MIVLKLGIGFNFLFHGTNRIFGDYGAFMEKVAAGFADTWVPAPLVILSAALIPVIEFAGGIMMLLGVWTFRAAVALGLLMSLLISGMVIQEQWSTVSGQMVYLVAIYLFLRDYEEQFDFSIIPRK